MKKTTAYARKRRAAGFSANGHGKLNEYAWLRTIKICRSYDDESILDEVPTGEIATNAIVNARTALQKMLDCAIDPDDTDPHDMLAHVIGMAQIRTLDIGGTGANAFMEILNEAAQALGRARERWQRLRKWGLDGPGIEPMKTAVDIYESILLASSPKQMEHAQMIRLDQVKNMQMEHAA
jgi:hypothetical protein